MAWVDFIGLQERRAVLIPYQSLMLRKSYTILFKIYLLNIRYLQNAADILCMQIAFTLLACFKRQARRVEWKANMTIFSHNFDRVVINIMQRPDPDSMYYEEFIELQKKLRDKIVSLRKSRELVQEDMANYELSVRQYQRMEQDPTAISSLWQLFKIAKAHSLDINQLLEIKWISTLASN